MEEIEKWQPLTEEKEEMLLNNLDSVKPINILMVSFPTSNIYTLSILLRLFEVLNILMEKCKSENIKICFILISDINKTELVKKTIITHYDPIIPNSEKYLNKIVNIRKIEFESMMKLFLLKSNIKGVKEIDTEFKSLEDFKEKPECLNFLDNSVIETTLDTNRKEIEREMIDIRKEIFLDEDYLLKALTKSLYCLHKENIILIAPDDVNKVIELIERKLAGIKHFNLSLKSKFFVDYPEPLKMFGSGEKTVPSFYTVISSYINSKEQSDFTVENVKDILKILNNRFFSNFPEKKEEEEKKKSIYEGFTALQESMIHELELIM